MTIEPTDRDVNRLNEVSDRDVRLQDEGKEATTLRNGRPDRIRESKVGRNLAAIARAGTSGNLRSHQPIYSPRIWNSIATGKAPEGEVVGGGRGRGSDDGKRIPRELAKGDGVIQSKFAGTEYKDGDDELLILRESDILAKIS